MLPMCLEVNDVNDNLGGPESGERQKGCSLAKKMSLESARISRIRCCIPLKDISRELHAAHKFANIAPT